MSLFISPAYAEGAAASAAGPGGFAFILIIGMMVIFYFFLIRPQNKRMKEHKALVEALSKGDEVVTTGGILGKITKVTDDYVVIEIANNMEIKIQRQSVQSTLPKGTIKGI